MKTEGLKWDMSATEKKVLREDGLALCSVRDPQLEAQQWLRLMTAQFKHQLNSTKSQTLGVLGLGAGYHIDELIKIYTKEIIVFENRPELVSQFPVTPGISIVHFDEHNLPLVSQQLCSKIDLLLPFRPCWGKQVDLYLRLKEEIIGADIKTMQLENWSHAGAGLRPQLELLWEIIR